MKRSQDGWSSRLISYSDSIYKYTIIDISLTTRYVQIYSKAWGYSCSTLVGMKDFHVLLVWYSSPSGSTGFSPTSRINTNFKLSSQSNWETYSSSLGVSLRYQGWLVSVCNWPDHLYRYLRLAAGSCFEAQAGESNHTSSTPAHSSSRTK